MAPELRKPKEEDLSACAVCRTWALDSEDLEGTGSDSKRFQAVQRSAEAGCLQCLTISTCLMASMESWKACLASGDLSVRRIPGSDSDTLTLRLTGSAKSNCVLPDMEIFVEEGEPTPWLSVCVKERLPVFSSDPKVFEQIKHWLKVCEDTHTRCNSSKADFAPTRLLSLTHVEDERSVVSLSTSHPMDTPYVALTHCWGSHADALKQHVMNLQNQKDGFAVSELPTTFSQAVTVTRSLGFRYLWIDALCIFQNSPDDFERELATLSRIYAQADLVISATLSSNNHRGFFSSRMTGHDNSMTLPGKGTFNLCIRPAIKHDEIKMRYPGGDKDFREWPVLTRAWCYQERLLGCRILHYTAHEVVWECKESMECECGLSHYAMNKESVAAFLHTSSEGRVRFEDAMTVWFDIVEQYSARNLTYNIDILPAISGVASAFSKHDFGPYVGGLWERSLPAAVCWHASINHNDKDRPHLGATIWNHRSNFYTGPSWSWSSIVGSVSWTETWKSLNLLCEASISEIRCTPTGNYVLGAVSEGHLVLVGRAVEITVSEFNDLKYPYARIAEGRSEADGFNIDSIEDVVGLAGAKVWCVCICNSRGKIQSPIAFPNDGWYVIALVLRLQADGNFRRIGLLNTLQQTLGVGGSSSVYTCDESGYARSISSPNYRDPWIRNALQQAPEKIFRIV